MFIVINTQCTNDHQLQQEAKKLFWSFHNIKKDNIVKNLYGYACCDKANLNVYIALSVYVSNALPFPDMFNSTCYKILTLSSCF